MATNEGKGLAMLFLVAAVMMTIAAVYFEWRGELWPGLLLAASALLLYVVAYRKFRRLRQPN